jgi:glutamate dehydrogenase/leucine dehydrogenase
VSGLEQSQNSSRIAWTRDEVDSKLNQIMADIHEQCVIYGGAENGYVDYVDGANIGGFVKVANAMLGYGIV